MFLADQFVYNRVAMGLTSLNTVWVNHDQHIELLKIPLPTEANLTIQVCQVDLKDNQTKIHSNQHTEKWDNSQIISLHVQCIKICRPILYLCLFTVTFVSYSIFNMFKM